MSRSLWRQSIAISPPDHREAGQRQEGERMIPPALLIRTFSITHREDTGEVDACGVPVVTTTT